MRSNWFIYQVALHLKVIILSLVKPISRLRPMHWTASKNGTTFTNLKCVTIAYVCSTSPVTTFKSAFELRHKYLTHFKIMSSIRKCRQICLKFVYTQQHYHSQFRSSKFKKFYDLFRESWQTIFVHLHTKHLFLWQAHLFETCIILMF